MHGGDEVAAILEREGVRFLFTLCGGHIAPILVSAQNRGIRVVDTRHEATAVFAADAVARLTGVPGVAAVTAGPGVTNTMTALRNALLAQSPLVLLGGATAGILRGRGALQDIDQLELVRGSVKWARRVRRVRDIPERVSEAFYMARSGVPGPVFLELPIDTLYDEALVRDWFAKSSTRRPRSVGERAQNWYLTRYVDRLFAGSGTHRKEPETRPSPPPLPHRKLEEVLRRLRSSDKPVFLLGSQVTVRPEEIVAVVEAVERLGVPVWLSGMARGLLGPDHPLQMRHRRREALRESDFVLLAGVPADFRLNYGKDIPRQAFHVALNLSRDDARKNRHPNVDVIGSPGRALIELAKRMDGSSSRRWSGWIASLRERDLARQNEIDSSAQERSDEINPLALCQQIDAAMEDQGILVADGGDFVSTASYILRPRSPLSWLDPGPFGTPRCRRRIRVGSGAGEAGGTDVDSLRRRGVRLLPGGVRYVRAPPHSGDRHRRQRRLLDSDLS